MMASDFHFRKITLAAIIDAKLNIKSTEVTGQAKEIIQ